ncbi:hypothetical protein D3C84_1212890 [compost metagenome]
MHGDGGERTHVHVIVVIGEGAGILLGPMRMKIIDAFNRLDGAAVFRSVEPPQRIGAAGLLDTRGRA